jgi:hypothetical protein
MVKLLLGEGANANAREGWGQTPLGLIADPSIANVYAPFSPMKASASVDEAAAVVAILKAHGGTM